MVVAECITISDYLCIYMYVKVYFSLNADDGWFDPMFYCFTKSQYEDKFILKGGIPQVEVWDLDPEYRDYQDKIDEKVVGGQRKNVIVRNNPCH